VTLRDNMAMTLNLLEAVRVEAPRATVVAVSSGEVYGPPERLPVDESAPLRPQNPYAVSKASADLLAGFYADAHGLRVIRPRSFNHAGPGQQPRYAIASFARQAAEGPRIVTGNPDARRDYTDVRDVVRAYRLLAERAEPGGSTSAPAARPRRRSWSRRSGGSRAWRSSTWSTPS
jgi:GDP-4-dehydro-6-deoxy-D-mannose reductase